MNWHSISFRLISQFPQLLLHKTCVFVLNRNWQKWLCFVSFWWFPLNFHISHIWKKNLFNVIWFRKMRFRQSQISSSQARFLSSCCCVVVYICFWKTGQIHSLKFDTWDHFSCIFTRFKTKNKHNIRYDSC